LNSMNDQFLSDLEARAKKNHARIGIGIWKSDGELVSSLKGAEEYAELLVVGQMEEQSDLEVHRSDEPWQELARMLASGEIDGAVRGNLPASRTMRALARQFDIRVRRLALLALPGWSFFFGPVGIDEGETVSHRLSLVTEGAKFLQRLGIDPRVSVLSGGRLEDLGRSERVDRSLAEGELIASRAREQGTTARHRGILIEDCLGDDLIIAPEGISGNLAFRTLLYLCRARAFGAPVLMEKVFVDSSRARGDFNGPVMLASALARI
jgi:putative methanogen marker protein 4